MGPMQRRNDQIVTVALFLAVPLALAACSELDQVKWPRSTPVHW